MEQYNVSHMSCLLEPNPSALQLEILTFVHFTRSSIVQIDKHIYRELQRTEKMRFILTLHLDRKNISYF